MKALFLLTLFSLNSWALYEQPYLVESKNTHEMTVLEHGADAFAERLRLIEKAQHSINVEYFIYSNDQAGRLMTQALIKKAREGVKVRMLLDSFSVKSVFTPQIAKLLREAGIEVKFYNPTPMIRIRKYMVRNHRKLLQIDEGTAILGGRNISDEYYDLNPEYSFVDRDVVVKGPVTRTIHESFEKYWEHEFSVDAETKYKKEDPAAKEFITETAKDRAALANIYKQSSIWNKNRISGTCNKVTFGTSKPGWGEESQSGEHLGNYLNKLISDAPKNSGGTGRVLIDSAYFIVDKKLRKVLTGVLKEGGQVDIITNSIHSHDVAVMTPATNISIRRLARKGVNFWYFKGEKPEGYNIAENFKTKKWASHVKSMIINDDTFMIGSYNFDPRAHHLNGEMAIICEDSPVLTKKLNGYFQDELNVSDKVSSVKDFKEKRFKNVSTMGKIKYFLAWPLSQMIRPLL